MEAGQAQPVVRVAVADAHVVVLVDVDRLEQRLIDEPPVRVVGVLVDVGGFLGIGEKRVALDANMLSLVPSADNSSVMLKVNATKEQLEALPEIKG